MSVGSELNHDSELVAGLEKADKKRKHGDFETPNVSKNQRICFTGVGENSCLTFNIININVNSSQRSFLSNTKYCHLVQTYWTLKKTSCFGSFANIANIATSSWEKIDADIDNINCQPTVLRWIFAAPFVKHLILRNWLHFKRTLLEGIGLCQHVETIKIRVGHHIIYGARFMEFGQHICKLVQRCPTLNYLEVKGYNATVFAYGATGAGKTHTMVGDPAEPGIMVRALNDLFNAVKDKEDQYTVTMSYLELYNEQIRDLLNPASGYLELREDSRGRNIQVAGLSEISTTSTNEVMLLLQKGNKARTVEPTAMNKTSSRSHALLSVTVKHSIPMDTKDHLRMRVKQGRLFMIDLAGSERANKTKSRGKRLQEGAHINRSLLALGNCINALSEGARYVNYRDSKLTRLLKEALSGNCRTVMIAHVSPSLGQKEESRNTLIYADRANNISNKVVRNIYDVSYQVTQYQTVINELRNEISRLQVKITDDRPRSAAQARLNTQQRTNEVRNLREQIVATFKEQMKLRRKLMEIDSHLLGLGMDAERQHLVISHWESRNNKLYKNNINQSRAQTQQSLRRKTTVVEGFRSADNAGHETADEASDGEIEGESSVQQAWGELADIEREQERWSELRGHIEQKLEDCRQRGVSLEDQLPDVLSSDDEREILALMCRVHELEADKMALQSERLVRQHELRRRDLVILRYDRQRQLCEEIITRQRQLMEENKLKLPPDLHELYQIYQQEIHAATYADYSVSPIVSPDKLPPISKIYSDPIFRRGVSTADLSASEGTPPSSAESDDPLPNVGSHNNIDHFMGHPVSRPGISMRLPPLQPPSPPSRLRGSPRKILAWP